ncbi:MAG: ABC-2 type transport system ATP-binding protein [Planctomycetota bacterium]|jgi:ABC-2 type transport system ATP-binding protein
MSNELIRIAGLQKSYDQRNVLHDINLSVQKGHLLGLIGPNGAGKSTLLRCLIGLVQRSCGELSLFGHDPAKHSLLIRRRASYLPGETGVYHQMTGARFLKFALGFYPKQSLELKERLLEQFDLPLHKKVRSYSAGMKQKLALIATLVPDVELYLLDEPDRALDASVRFYLRDVLRALKDAGKTIVLSSHHLSEVEALADRLEFLLNGRFVSHERLQRARTHLRRQPRIRLHSGQTLPLGAKLIRKELDGMLVVETDHDPMQWLRSLPQNVVESAEVGVDRLEDLYQLLLQDDGAPRCGVGLEYGEGEAAGGDA